MSDSAPPRATPRAIPLGPPGVGMISPATPFVAEDGTLAPVGFRFLFELWMRVGDIERRLAAAGIP